MDTSANLDHTKRSPWLASRQASLLVVIDLQERLVPLIDGAERIQWNVERLLRGARLLDVPSLVTQQYPERLGMTVGQLNSLADDCADKRMFSCRECSQLFVRARQQGLHQAVLCGIETHVCVLQTAIDLLADNWQVYLVADAVGARGAVDHRIAIDRISRMGGIIATTESILFEWCETSIDPKFKGISQLVRQAPPVELP